MYFFFSRSLSIYLSLHYSNWFQLATISVFFCVCLLYNVLPLLLFCSNAWKKCLNYSINQSANRNLFSLSNKCVYFQTINDDMRLWQIFDGFLFCFVCFFASLPYSECVRRCRHLSHKVAKHFFFAGVDSIFSCTIQMAWRGKRRVWNKRPRR